MKNKNDDEPAANAELEVDADRRKFLATCGRFAAVTPPAVTLLLSTSLNSDAIASSGAVEVEGRIAAPTCLAGLIGSLTGCSRQPKVRRAIAGRVARGFGFRFLGPDFPWAALGV